MSQAASLVAEVRAFNRFYTQAIGVLGEGHLESDLSLSEVRVLYEIAHRDGPSATEIGRDLAIDPGYLSRILAAFQKKGWVSRRPSGTDRRRSVLALTGRGKKKFASLDTRADQDVAGLLQTLDPSSQERMVEAMRLIRSLVSGEKREAPGEVTLRGHRPGDMGTVVARHGALYAREYGWDARFEALVARVTADFVDGFDARRDRCFIAEIGGTFVGSSFVVAGSKTVAKLRLLLVEPSARGRGVGSRLVKACIVFARHAGYRKMTLWTNDVLVDARRIYEREGFRLIAEQPHHDFGEGLVGQTFELDLARATSSARV